MVGPDESSIIPSAATRGAERRPWPTARRWRGRGARHALPHSASFLQMVILGSVPNYGHDVRR